MSTSSHPETATANGRDDRGRFTPGNSGGPGNPFARQVAGLRKALLDSVSAEDIAAIARALIEKAKSGDVAAAKLVLGYVVGKPTAAVDPDRLDVGEWQNFKETATMVKELPGVVQTPEPELPLTMVRATRPAMTRKLAGQLSALLGMPEKFVGDPTVLERQLRGAAPSANRSNGKRAQAPKSAGGSNAQERQTGPSRNGQNRRGTPSRNGSGGGR